MTSCPSQLHPSHLTHLFQFFLRGTQLQQLSEEYELIMENISSMSKILHGKKQALPDLETQYEEASIRFEEASKAREQKERANELKKELAWAHVAVKEEVRSALP